MEPWVRDARGARQDRTNHAQLHCVTTASAALPPEHGYRSGYPVMLRSDPVLLSGDCHLRLDSAGQLGSQHNRKD